MKGCCMLPNSQKGHLFKIMAKHIGTRKVPYYIIIFALFILFASSLGNDDSDLIARFPSKEENSGIVRATVVQRNLGSQQQHHDHKQPHHQHKSHHGDGHSWGYEDHNGPHTWGKHCRHGTRQSPVDIRTSNLEFAYINELHFTNYELSGAVELKNNGHGVVVSGFDKWGPRQRPYIYGGGLSGKYLLAQFHFHWAVDHEDGSEHTVNDLHYPVELHLVHVKEGFTISEAVEQPDGLAVVGIFYHLGKEGNSMANLETGLKRVVEKDAATLIFNYTVGVHLPPVLDNFYRYHGSLTTPGCSEAVIWTVMAEPVPILAQQLDLLRAIHGPIYGKRLGDNVRPVQPLNGRRVQFRSSALNRHKICGNESLAVRPTGNGVAASNGWHFKLIHVILPLFIPIYFETMCKIKFPAISYD